MGRFIAVFVIALVMVDTPARAGAGAERGLRSSQMGCAASLKLPNPALRSDLRYPHLVRWDADALG